jgi:hypothetical protein
VSRCGRFGAGSEAARARHRWLEVELRGQLDLSGRRIAAQSRSQNAGGRGYRLDDLPEPRVGNVAYRLVEVGVVQNVKEAGTNDELLALTFVAFKMDRSVLKNPGPLN